MWDAFLDSLIDSLKLLPYLFAAYLLIEYIEHSASEKLALSLTRFGKFSPAAGAAAGLVPQCGFSVTAAHLYSGGLITLGTLAAVFISTSDEALPILMASADGRGAAFTLMAIKLFAALLFGFLLDAVVKRNKHNDLDEFHRHLHEHCDEDCCDHGILRPSINHTVTSFLFILVSIFVINCVFIFVGEARVAAAFPESSLVQPLVASVIGFIPGCASSILLTELYLSGALTFGSLTAGLITNTGLGMLVLLRSNKSKKEAIALAAFLLAAALAVGYIVQIFIK